MRLAKPSEKYAIESCYMGENPPWVGWKVTRLYCSATERDEALSTLRKTVKSTLWLYRAKE